MKITGIIFPKELKEGYSCDDFGVKKWLDIPIGTIIKWTNNMSFLRVNEDSGAWKLLYVKIIKDTKIARKLNQGNIIAEQDGYIIIKE